MRYLKSKSVFEHLDNGRLDGFIDDLTKELAEIEFDLTYSYEDGFIQIDKQGVGTYIDFVLTEIKEHPSDFSIKELKRKCNEILDDDKSGWKCSDLIKDDYDLLCTTILIFIDEYEKK